MRKFFLCLATMSMAFANTYAESPKGNVEDGNDSYWKWITSEQPHWSDVRCYTYLNHPGYMVYPHGKPTCQDCSNLSIDEQFKMLSVYDEYFNLVRIVKVKQEWLSEGLHSALDDLKKIPLQLEYAANRNGIKDKPSANTVYAVENLIGLRNDEERLKALSLEFSLKSYAKGNASMQAQMSAEEKQQLDDDWYRLNKMDIKGQKKAHKAKMDDEKANDWYDQAFVDLNVEGYKVKEISRIDDLSFMVLMQNDKTGKECKAKLTFYQEKLGKFGVKYKVSAM